MCFIDSNLNKSLLYYQHLYFQALERSRAVNNQPFIKNLYCLILHYYYVLT